MEKEIKIANRKKMIVTKILGLTAAVSKSKKLKMALLLTEVALLAIAFGKDKKLKEEEEKKS